MVQRAIQHAKKQPITDRPADLLHPEWEHLRADALALPGCNGSDEDVLTFAMFPQVAPKFFASRSQGPKNLSKDPVKAKAAAAPAEGGQKAAPQKGQLTEPVTYTVTYAGKSHQVTVAPSD